MAGSLHVHQAGTAEHRHGPQDDLSTISALRACRIRPLGSDVSIIDEGIEPTLTHSDTPGRTQNGQGQGKALCAYPALRTRTAPGQQCRTRGRLLAPREAIADDCDPSCAGSVTADPLLTGLPEGLTRYLDGSQQLLAHITGQDCLLPEQDHARCRQALPARRVPRSKFRVRMTCPLRCAFSRFSRSEALDSPTSLQWTAS